MAETDRSRGLPADVQAALSRGEFIEAIKLLRGSTGLGLKEAKDTIDRFRQRAPATRSAVATKPAKPANPAMTAATATERETESFRDGRAPFSPGEVPRSHTRVWFIVVVAALLYLLWRVVRATAA